MRGTEIIGFLCKVILFGGIGILAILLFSAIVALVASAGRFPPPGLLCFGTLGFLLITAFPAAILQTKVIRATLINDQVIELSGVSRQFADKLQEERRKRMRAKPAGHS